jgi:hypothetical protein
MSAIRTVPGHLMVIGMLGAAGVAFAAVGWNTDPLSRAVTVMQTVPIFDDDGGDAMFAATAMTPGVPVSRCIRIGYDDADAAGPVRLAAESVSGTLAGHLRIAVDRGSTGGFGDCTGFAGTSIYRGTLTGLENGVATGWTPAKGSGQTFRITATLTDATAPTVRMSARADFVWRVQGAGVPSATPAASPAAPSAPAATPSVAEPSHRSRTALQTLLQPIVKLGREAARHVAIPIVMIILLIAFLLLQNAADRRDPKLALAPVWRNRYFWIPLPPKAGK